MTGSSDVAGAGVAPLRVLIADDDPIIRLDLRQMLLDMGYQVVAEAEDGSEALSKARDVSPDVCILDIKMPNVDGLDVAAALADEGTAPSVILTAYSDRELIDRAAVSGVFGYIVKPFKPSDLPPAIEVARSRFAQNMQLCKEVADLTERLEVRKLLDRAKGILMDQLGITEAEAYRRIQQQSMNERRSMRQIAEALITSQQIRDSEPVPSET